MNTITLTNVADKLPKNVILFSSPVKGTEVTKYLTIRTYMVDSEVVSCVAVVVFDGEVPKVSLHTKIEEAISEYNSL